MRDVRFRNLPSDHYGPIRIRRHRDFEVVGVGFFAACDREAIEPKDFDGGDDQILCAPRQVIEEASVAKFRHAVGAYSKHRNESGHGYRLLISEDPPDAFEPEASEYLPIQLKVSSNEVAVLAESSTPDVLRSSRPVLRLLSPLVSARGAFVSGVTRIDGVRGSAVSVEVQISRRGLAVGDVLRLGEDVRLLLHAAFANGPLRPATAAELLRTGRHDTLVDQPEQDWLDAKSRLYELNDIGKFHLACDVAAFANAKGGLIAIGLSTATRRGEEIIGRARAVPLAGFSKVKHRQVLRDWLYPLPIGVRFDVCITSVEPDKGLVVIEVPEQSDALKPFVVRRAELAGRLRTESLTIPVRASDATAHKDIAEIHSLIVAGRAALATWHTNHLSEPDTAE